MLKKKYIYIYIHNGLNCCRHRFLQIINVIVIELMIYHKPYNLCYALRNINTALTQSNGSHLKYVLIPGVLPHDRTSEKSHLRKICV